MAPKAPKFELKTPKGTKDWDGSDMVLRDKIFGAVTEVFSAQPRLTSTQPQLLTLCHC